MTQKRKLTPKQERFVEEYLCDLNATAAAIRAGYSRRTANNQGFKVMRMPHVQEAIAGKKTARSARVEVTADWILSRLVENVERSMQAEPVYDREGKETGEYVYQGNVANKALELLGKHHGMFSDNLNLRTPDGPIAVTITRRIVQPT